MPRELYDDEQELYDRIIFAINREITDDLNRQNIIYQLDIFVEKLMLAHERELKEKDVRIDELRRCIYRLGQNKTSSES